MNENLVANKHLKRFDDKVASFRTAMKMKLAAANSPKSIFIGGADNKRNERDQTARKNKIPGPKVPKSDAVR